MRPIWWLLPLLLLVACDLRAPWQDNEFWADELNELAIATFVTDRSERGLPPGRLEYRAGSIYSTEPEPGPGGLWVWQVHYPRLDAVRVPVTARDRLAGVDLSVDGMLRFEQRYCTLPAGPQERLRCQAWQPTICCNLLWKRTRGAWLASPP